VRKIIDRNWSISYGYVYAIVESALVSIIKNLNFLEFFSPIQLKKKMFLIIGSHEQQHRMNILIKKPKARHTYA